MVTPQSGFLGNIDREFEEREIEKQAKAQKLGYVDFSKFAANPDILKLVSPEDAKNANVFPLSKNGKKLSIAVVNPEDGKTQSFLESLTKEGLEPDVFLCSASGFAEALKSYDSEFLKKKEVERTTGFEEKSGANLKEKIKDLSDLEKKLDSLHAETALSEIEVAAINTDASDIHFQPTENGAELRFRIDGVLHNVLEVSAETTKKLVTRIKYEAGMKSNISNIPQDGHRTFEVNGRSIDLRISTLPTPFGESVVMRILDASRGLKSFTDLGFSETAREKIEQSLEQKTGLILVTGPTGSGKTTTLYSMLSQLNLPERKIVTLEDPIEYHLEGISQSQVDEEMEYDFENGFSALLRHDPDVILVGEIRSRDTAHLASEAALTGHIVLSSLHTNSAVGSLSRLRNLGMENFNIAPTISAVFAQRLVRKVCPHCQTKVPLPHSKKIETALEQIQKTSSKIVIPDEIAKAVGCEKCSGTGYKDRMAICEDFIMTDKIRKMVLEEQSEIEILKVLRKNDKFLSLFEDGLMKVFSGETTLEELYRVTS